MKGEEQVLLLQLGEEKLALMRKNKLIEGKPSLPCEDFYRIEFNTDYFGQFDDIQLPRALIMIINILAGIGERTTQKSSEFSLNKEDFLTMAGLYAHVNSRFLVDSLQEIQDMEEKAMIEEIKLS
jgi:hypothetical protein